MTIKHSQFREHGKVSVNANLCTHCGLCVNTCPAEALSIDNGKILQIDSAFGCIACGHCMMVCPNDAIKVSGRGISPEDIVDLPSDDRIATQQQLSNLFISRRSVRKFTDKPVEPEKLEKIIEMASTAPMGIPPWDVGCVTVTGRQNVRKLSDDVVKGYEGLLKIFKPWLLRLMRPMLGKAKYEMFNDFILPLAKTYIEHNRQGRDVIFYDAPAVMVFHYSPFTESTDATIACTYAMLAAESLGLASTIIGGAAPIIQRNKKLCKSLGVPEGNTPSVVLIVGYSAVKFRKAIRRNFSHINTTN